MSEYFENSFLQSQVAQCSLPEGSKGKLYTIQGVRVNFPHVAYPSQVALMDKIIRSLRNKQNCLLESPTGSGKSLAFLCAALAWQKKELERILELEAAADAANQILTERQLNSKYMKTKSGSKDVCSYDEQPKPGNRACCSTEDDDFQPEKRFRISNASCNTLNSTPMKTQPATTGQQYIIQLPPNLSSPVVLNLDGTLWSFANTTPEESTLSVTTPINTTAQHLQETPAQNQPSRPRLHRPKIFFCTRTHKQVKQITRELAKTNYSDAKMCILSSRENTCIHPHVSKQMNKNEGCQELLKSPVGVQCTLYSHARNLDQHTIKDHGLNLAWDLEDMVSLGKKLHFCPYFGLRELMQSSDIIFCPYNYLTDPLIRSSLSIAIKDQVVIFDEGHNIEDCAREASSFSVNQDSLDEAIKDLEGVHGDERQPFAHILSRMSTWILRNSKNLADYSDFDRAGKVLAGQDLVAMMTEFGAGPDKLTSLRKQFAQISGDDPKVIPVASVTLQILKGLLFTLDFLYRDELKFMADYRCVIVKTFVPRKHNDSASGWRQKTLTSTHSYTYTLNFWCMNPGVCFSDFHNVHSLIVTSGTLSPMTSFQSELSVSFPIAFEANHVIKKTQVWVGTIGCGPNNFPLKAIYQNTESLQFQDELGEVVLQVCRTVPYGILCFFPSYSNLDKMKTRWELTGLMDKIEQIKLVVVEPRANNKVVFEEILEDFYSAVEEGNGALFLAVYRGKVSEGLNFSDNNARAVITIGIPYPNVKDMQVDLKQKYNNQHCSQRLLMSGRDWYEAQAFRALNQALGRCIRHKDDWGALILIDQRFQSNVKCTKSLSKWVRNELRHYSNFSEAVDSLQYFVKNAASAISSNSVLNSSTTSALFKINTPSKSEINHVSFHDNTPTRFQNHCLPSTSTGTDAQPTLVEEKENFHPDTPEVIDLCDSPDLF